jgi:hypothetical protein
MVVRVKYKQSNRVSGEKECWLVSTYETISDINIHKSQWIADYFWSNSKTKPSVMVVEILSKKQIGTTSRQGDE